MPEFVYNKSILSELTEEERKTIKSAGSAMYTLEEIYRLLKVKESLSVKTLFSYHVVKQKFEGQLLDFPQITDTQEEINEERFDFTFEDMIKNKPAGKDRFDFTFEDMIKSKKKRQD